MSNVDMFYGSSPAVFAKAKALRESMTPTERLLWEQLNNNQLNGYRFRRQHPIGQYITDFYCHVAKLVVEVNGSVHNLGEQQEYDAARTEVLVQFGLKVIRFANEEVELDLEKIVDQIKVLLPASKSLKSTKGDF